MAKLTNLTIQASFTVCPGTNAYMPPEVLSECDPPVNTTKIDCFAIGVIIIQILTRQFPEPRVRYKRLTVNHPELPSGHGTVEARVPEKERRQSHINLVDGDHPLLPIALVCLSDNELERPEAQELCHRVAA